MTNNTTPTATELFYLLCDPKEESEIYKNSEFPELLAKRKTDAIARKDEYEAFQLWCAETIYSIQQKYISAFNSLKAGRFYEAWCQFERCEIDINSLERHYTSTSEDLHKIKFIEIMTQRWQSLYPYKYFFSPEFLKKRVECSICGARVSPRSYCEHEKSKIYWGEMCCHIITEVEVLGISLVDNPVQRYSVAFLSQDGTTIDHYNYGNLNFLIERLDSAFTSWDYHNTTRVIDASEVEHLNHEHLCPCLSGKQFGECCIGEDNITVPHLQIELSVPPSKDLPENELLF